MVLMLAFLAMGLPTMKKVQGIWKKAKKQVSETGKELGEKIGVDDLKKQRTEDDGLIEVEGMRYMPVYHYDQFVSKNTTAGQEMVKLARAAFAKKYPRAQILYSVVPQEDWTSTIMCNGETVTGYRRHAYAYVVAKDGNDGYLNARFLFREDKQPGQDYVKSSAWPLLERTDAIPNQVYPKLIQ